ncbi:MAG TPA: hypothetical protein VKE69_13600 [Planctomycetota bacterium]|nr:hypothetical protein [Planctomycetota bacterium]
MRDRPGFFSLRLPDWLQDERYVVAVVISNVVAFGAVEVGMSSGLELGFVGWWGTTYLALVVTWTAAALWRWLPHMPAIAAIVFVPIAICLVSAITMTLITPAMILFGAAGTDSLDWSVALSPVTYVNVAIFSLSFASYGLFLPSMAGLLLPFATTLIAISLWLARQPPRTSDATLTT